MKFTIAKLVLECINRWLSRCFSSYIMHSVYFNPFIVSLYWGRLPFFLRSAINVQMWNLYEKVNFWLLILRRECKMDRCESAVLCPPIANFGCILPYWHIVVCVPLILYYINISYIIFSLSWTNVGIWHSCFLSCTWLQSCTKCVKLLL